VGGYTFDGCVDIATSDDFLASCEELGVEESILSACLDAGGPEDSCLGLAAAYGLAFGDDCAAAIAAAVTRRGTNHTIPAATKLEATTTDL
jgi:hypothetical protein